MRIHSLRLLRGFGATDLIAYLYPRIFSLHNMPDEVHRVRVYILILGGFLR